jgi:hypothetical protein
MYYNRYTFRCLAQLIEFVCAFNEMPILSRSDDVTFRQVAVLQDFVHRLAFRKECDILNAGAILILS